MHYCKHRHIGKQVFVGYSVGLPILQPHLEEPGVEDGDAPVRQCHLYFSHRRKQLDYQNALASNLPIGSGKIESAHRNIVQKRLKLPGSWWCAANVDYMLSLRLNRANRQWDAY